MEVIQNTQNWMQSNREALLRKLHVVGNIVERRSTKPILSNLLLRMNGQHLTLVGTDGEMQMQTQLDEVGLFDDAVTVSARKFGDILRALPEDSDVRITLDAQRKVQVSSRKARFALQTLPAEEFPLVIEPTEWAAKVSLPQKVLKQLFNQVHFAMAQQDLRYYLNGVLLQINEGGVTAAATDGHRLAYAFASADNVQQKTEVIVPRKTVLELYRLLDENSEEMVDIFFAGNQVKFCFADITLIGKLVEGRFPDYSRVIPKHFEHHMVFNREVLLHSLQRAAILTTDKFRGVRWALKPGSLMVGATNTDQEEAQDEIEVEYSGPAINMGFNVGYLIDVLSCIKDETLQFSVQDDNSGVLISRIDSEHFKYVVMPMRI